MLALLLSLVLSQAPKLPTSDVLQDLEFTAASESFVATQPGTTPPEPYRGLIAELGSEVYSVRAVASAQLTEASRHDPRFLFWARMSRDQETRLRANAILRALHPCTSCKGSGSYAETRGPFEGVKQACYRCNAWGSEWVWSAWE